MKVEFKTEVRTNGTVKTICIGTSNRGRKYQGNAYQNPTDENDPEYGRQLALNRMLEKQRRAILINKHKLYIRTQEEADRRLNRLGRDIEKLAEVLGIE